MPLTISTISIQKAHNTLGYPFLSNFYKIKSNIYIFSDWLGRLNANVKKIRHTNRGQCEAVIKSRMNLIMVNRWPQVASTFVDWGLSFVLFDLYRMFIVEDAIRERNTISALLWNLSIFTFSHRHCGIEIRYLNWIVFFYFMIIFIFLQNWMVELFLNVRIEQMTHSWLCPVKHFCINGKAFWIFLRWSFPINFFQQLDAANKHKVEARSRSCGTRRLSILEYFLSNLTPFSYSFKTTSTRKCISGNW